MTRGVFRFVSGSMPKDQVKLQDAAGHDRHSRHDREDAGRRRDWRARPSISNTALAESTTARVRASIWAKATWPRSTPDGTIGTPDTKWSAGDESVDFGLNPFGQREHGTEGGTGGSDGAGSSGGGDSGQRGQ